MHFSYQQSHQKFAPIMQTHPISILHPNSKRSSSPLSLTAPKKRQRHSSPFGKSSIGPSNVTTIEDERKYNDESIVWITQQQNKNLKEQNRFLLEKIKNLQERSAKMKQNISRAKKYKQLYQSTKLQLEITKQKCQANKKTAKQMKKIAKMGMWELRQKVQHLNSSSGSELKKSGRKIDLLP